MPPEPAPTSGRLSDATYANIVAHILGKDGGQLLTSGVGIGPATHPDAADGMIGRVQAIDVENHTLTWMHEQVSAISTGVLATSSGVVFAGDTDPSLKAFDDTTGELLGEYGLDDLPSSSIITYRAGGTQYRVG